MAQNCECCQCHHLETSSSSRMRKYLRWADYTMIAIATMCLSRALRNENPKLLMTASTFSLPIQPLMVSTVHTRMMKVGEIICKFENKGFALKVEVGLEVVDLSGRWNWIQGWRTSFCCF